MPDVSHKPVNIVASPWNITVRKTELLVGIWIGAVRILTPEMCVASAA